MDGAPRFPLALLAFAVREGWLEVLGREGDFAARDIEPTVRLDRGEALAKLREGERVGLIEELGRRGRGGAFRWQVTALGRELRAAILELIGAPTTEHRTEVNSGRSSSLLAVMAVVDERAAGAIRGHAKKDLYAELRSAVERGEESAEVFEIRIEPSRRRG